MAIVKLVCQGCGANLDAMDDQRVLQCGYCGTSNQIKQTVHAQPRPQVAAPPPPPPQFQQPLQINVPSVNPSPGRSRGVLVIILITALLPLIIGGIITYSVFRVTSEVIDSVDFSGPQINISGPGSAGAAGVTKFRWQGARPVIADVNGDGREDILGLIVQQPAQTTVLATISGADFSLLSTTGFDFAPESPTLYYDGEAKRLLVANAGELVAHDLQDRARLWTARLPDKVEAVARDGDHYFVASIDDSGSAVAFADGKVTPAAKPGPDARALVDDGEYELIPEQRGPDLKFSELRVEQSYCPEQAMPFVAGRRTKASELRCDHAHGLAFAVRAKGTQIPFIVGYDPKTRAERWRNQLTLPGSLETVASGFAQPRAELFGDDAIVSFALAKDPTVQLRRLSLTDGATKWQVALGSGPGDNVEGIAVGDERVYVMIGDELRVFALADGEQLAALGGR